MSQISSHVIVHRYNSSEVVFQHQPDRVGIFSTFFFGVPYLRLYDACWDSFQSSLFLSLKDCKDRK